jgi:hypothetical protein
MVYSKTEDKFNNYLRSDPARKIPALNSDYQPFLSGEDRARVVYFPLAGRLRIELQIRTTCSIIDQIVEYHQKEYDIISHQSYDQENISGMVGHFKQL